MVGLSGDLCRDVLAYWSWVDESILSTNLRLEEIEAQGVSRFPERKEHFWAAVGEIMELEIYVKTL